MIEVAQIVDFTTACQILQESQHLKWLALNDVKIESLQELHRLFIQIDHKKDFLFEISLDDKEKHFCLKTISRMFTNMKKLVFLDA